MEIVSAIATKFIDLTVAPVGRQLGYLILYKTNVDKLKTSVEKLKTKMADTNISVEEAKQIGESNVLPSVQKWIEEVEGTIADATAVIQKEAQGEGRCLKWPFPSLSKRYKLSREAKKLEGHVSNAMSEAKFERVCYRPRPEMSLPPSARDYEAVLSRTSMLDTIKQALKNPAMCMVGVYGMGGVGKTTLVKELAWQAEKEGLFAIVVMATITSAPNLRGIQDQLADGLGLKLASEIEEGRAAELRRRMCGEKSILVILDDTWGVLDLTQVGIPYGDQHKGCKLVLTARDFNVLSRMGTQKEFLLGVLSEEESWNLFEKVVGGVLTSNNIKPIAIEVAKCCFGLPLLIVTVAKALRKKEDVRVWKDSLKRLEVFDPADFHESVSNRLKFSYECLKSEELRSLFLLIGSFEHGFNNPDGSFISEILVPICWSLGLYKNVRTLEEARNRHHTLVKDLMDSSLLLNSEMNSVRMHDLIRDMAKLIASTTCPTYISQPFSDINEWPDKDQLQKCHHIILPWFFLSELPENVDFPKLKLFSLQVGVNKLNVQDSFFSRMPELKVLCFDSSFNSQSLPSSLCLLTCLRSLKLSGEFEGIAIIGELRTLEILELADTKMKELPKEIGNLSQLRLLSVTNCRRLRLIPRNLLSNLKCLEELYMLDCTIEWEAEESNSHNNNASLAELKSLNKLTHVELRIKDASAFPKNLHGFANPWEKYKIIIGTEDHYDYLNAYTEYCSRSLRLRDPGASTVYMSRNNMARMLLNNAEKLYIADLECIEDIHLGLNGDGSLPTQSYDSYHMLKSITVENCNKLKNLLVWSKVTNFSQLRKVSVSECQSVKAIIADESCEIETIELPELRHLELYSLPNLVSFCLEAQKFDMEFIPSLPLIDKKVEMPSLEAMYLFGINSCKIWDDNKTHSSVQNLKSLRISDCHNLRILFPYSLATALVKLEHLDIKNCKMLQEIFEEEENPVNQDPLLNPVSSEQVILPNLKELQIRDLKNLKSLWCNQMAPNSFYRLSQIKISNCPKLMNPFPLSVLNHLLNLEALQVNQFDDLQVIFELQELKVLEVSNCDVYNIVEKSETGEVRRINLEKLEINYCGRLKNIVTSFVVFQNLTMLTVTDCNEIANIMTVPSTATSLPELRVLKISECDMIEEIVASEYSNNDGGAASEIAFMKLEELELSFLWRLKCFCKGTCYSFKFPSLHTVRIKVCPMMENFCDGNLTAPNLKEVITSWDWEEEEEEGISPGCWDGE